MQQVYQLFNTNSVTKFGELSTLLKHFGNFKGSFWYFAKFVHNLINLQCKRPNTGKVNWSSGHTEQLLHHVGLYSNLLQYRPFKIRPFQTNNTMILKKSSLSLWDSNLESLDQESLSFTTGPIDNIKNTLQLQVFMAT